MLDCTIKFINTVKAICESWDNVNDTLTNTEQDINNGCEKYEIS